MPSPRKPAVFLGSSKEGLDVAKTIQRSLGRSSTVWRWDDNFFRLGKGYLEALVEALQIFDFAVLVATPDDRTRSRGKEQFSPRDNIVFELGLFIGHIGRERTYLVHPQSHKIKIPTDLAGVSTVGYPWPMPERIAGYVQHLRGACHQLRSAIRELGPRVTDKASGFYGIWIYRVEDRTTHNSLYGVFRLAGAGSDVELKNGNAWYVGYKPAVENLRATFSSQHCTVQGGELIAWTTVMSVSGEPRAIPAKHYHALIQLRAEFDSDGRVRLLVGSYWDHDGPDTTYGHFFAQRSTKEALQDASREASRRFGQEGVSSSMS